jgi:hypothetical protein
VKTAITKEYIIRELLDNAEKAKKAPRGSSVHKRALELVGKKLGMFVDRAPVKAPKLEDLSTEDLERMLSESVCRGRRGRWPHDHKRTTGLVRTT